VAMGEKSGFYDKFRVIREDHIVEDSVIQNPNNTITLTYIPELDREHALRFVLSLNTDPPAFAAAWLYSKLCHPSLADDLRQKLRAVDHHGWRLSKTGMKNLAGFIRGMMTMGLKSVLGDMPSWEDR